MNEFQAADGTVYEVKFVYGEKAEKNRIYISGNMEETELEFPTFPGYGDEEALKAYDKGCKAYNKAAAAIWKKHIKNAAEALKLDIGEIAFSMKAGCSCSCSPGFISSVRHNTSIFITVK